MDVKVVKYNNRPFVWWRTNGAGKAQLIGTDGNKYSGTPDPDKLSVMYAIPCKPFNKSWHFGTKRGIFSARTGNRIRHPKIIAMFKPGVQL